MNVVLVVDDSAFVRETLKTQLLEKQCDVLLANDGEEALSILKDNTLNKKPLPNIIILDIEMPNMDGISFLKVIQELNEFKHIPIIVFSSLSTKRLKEITSSWPIYKCVSKTANDGELFDTVAEILDNEGAPNGA